MVGWIKLCLQPTNEVAVGLEKFEGADIQANIITHQRELKIGESLQLEIELVNAGKKPAILIKTEQIIPEGFELKTDDAILLPPNSEMIRGRHGIEKFWASRKKWT
jgi:hypothetical protein